jgi:acetyl-CoA acetyltransferase family protein
MKLDQVSSRTKRREAIGRYNDSLKDIRPDDLAAIVIAEAVRRANIDPATIDDVILGCVNQAGEDNRNVARVALLLAGLPVETPGQTVNRLCGSGLQAINSAALAIQAGAGSTFIAGGLESATRAPFILAKPDTPFSRHMHLEDSTIGWRFINPRFAAMYHPYSSGETAENIAERSRISQVDQDIYALRSHQRAIAAQRSGHFVAEIVPVLLPEKKHGEPQVFAVDEQPRSDTTLEKLSRLKPVFRKNVTVTAGNSAILHDGAAAIVLMAHNMVRQPGLQSIARIVNLAVIVCDTAYMGLGPIFATRKVLWHSGLSLKEIDLIELNESFAAQAIQCIRELEIDEAKLTSTAEQLHWVIRLVVLLLAYSSL